MKLKSFFLLVVLLLILNTWAFGSGIQKKLVDDSAYDSEWNGDTINAPSRNATYDKVNEVIVSTGALAYNVGQSTGALVVVDYNIGQDTGTLLSKQDEIIISTGTLVKKTGDTMTGELIVSSTTRITENATLEKNIYLGGFLFHYGDTNTYLRFSDDDVLIQAGALKIIQGCEGTTDVIHIGDADWDYMIIGDTTTAVYITTYTYSTGEWSFPADVYVNKGDKVIATSSMTWSAGDMLFYDGFNWVIRSTEAKSAGNYSEIGTDGLPKWTSKSYLTVDIDTSTVTSTTADVWKVVAGTFTVSINNGFTIQNSITGSTITYVGAETKYFQVNVGISVSASGTNEDVHYRLAQNGTMIPRSEQHRRIAVAGDIGFIGLPWQLNLATDDTFNLRILTETGDTMTHEHLVITVAQID